MLLEMLKYMRPEGSDTQRAFCETYLEPVMGPPDRHGNYILEVGDEPTIAFMAHHDTVHRGEGKQVVLVDDFECAYVTESSCLGADCTTGVWLVLEMIKAGVEGVYVVHAGEEIGCVGSGALVSDNPPWLRRISAAIAFDRYGTTSIITHQMGCRTASDDFAYSLADALDMPALKPDDGGSYTDSNEYSSIVPECTNLSVGYYRQHTAKETQDMEFAYSLRDKLIKADWSKLVIKRDPSVLEYADDWFAPYSRHYYSTDPLTGKYSGKPDDYFGNEPGEEDVLGMDLFAEVVAQYPEEVAAMLRSFGFTVYDVLDEAGIDYGESYQRAVG